MSQVLPALLLGLKSCQLWVIGNRGRGWESQGDFHPAPAPEGRSLGSAPPLVLALGLLKTPLITKLFIMQAMCAHCRKIRNRNRPKNKVIVISFMEFENVQTTPPPLPMPERSSKSLLHNCPGVWQVHRQEFCDGLGSPSHISETIEKRY